MTCIAGIAHEGRVYLGGDSAAIDAWDRLTTRADPKVFRKGPYVFGFTDSFRMGQLLRYSFDPPVPGPSCALLHGFLCTTFVDALRECFKAGGYAKAENEAESGGCFLVGIGGRLFKVESDYQVSEAACGYDACGSGQWLAQGSLFTTAILGDLDPLTRIKGALEAAQAHASTVRCPFTFVSVP